MNRKVFKLKNEDHTLEQLHSQIQKTVDKFNERQKLTKEQSIVVTQLADSLGVTKKEKESIKTRIEKCLPLYYKHLDSIGAANNAYNLEEFLEWFN